MIAGGEPAGLQGQNRTWVRDDSKQEGNQLGYRVRIHRTWVRYDSRRGVSWVRES